MSETKQQVLLPLAEAGITSFFPCIHVYQLLLLISTALSFSSENYLPALQLKGLPRRMECQQAYWDELMKEGQRRKRLKISASELHGFVKEPIQVSLPLQGGSEKGWRSFDTASFPSTTMI